MTGGVPYRGPGVKLPQRLTRISSDRSRPLYMTTNRYSTVRNMHQPVAKPTRRYKRLPPSPKGSGPPNHQSHCLVADVVPRNVLNVTVWSERCVLPARSGPGLNGAEPVKW